MTFALLFSLHTMLQQYINHSVYTSPTPISTPVIVQPQRLLLRNNQYYQTNFAGIQKLCDADPILCTAPGVQEDIEHIRSERTKASSVLIVGGISGVAAMIIGSILTSHAVLSDMEHPKSLTPGLAVLGGGVVLTLSSLWTAMSMAPTNQDYLTLINHLNQADPGHPLMIQ